MLQHNVHAEAGRRAHLAHAAMVSLHSVCCGLPILALSLAALSGAATGWTLFAQTTVHLHAILHKHELWILALSATLVVIGGVFELRARAGQARRGFPWLYALSAACFALNLAIILLHRAG